MADADGNAMTAEQVGMPPAAHMETSIVVEFGPPACNKVMAYPTGTERSLAIRRNAAFSTRAAR